jgi:hypothetical protein
MKEQVSTSRQRVVQPNGQQSNLNPDAIRQDVLAKLERNSDRADRNTGIVDDMVQDQLKAGEEVDIRLVREVFRGCSTSLKVDVARDTIAHRAAANSKKR